MVSGCVVYTDLLGTYDEAKRAEFQTRITPGSEPPEIQRVLLFESGGCYYELIRGGRWVDWWEAQYGVHKDEVREKIRCTS